MFAPFFCIRAAGCKREGWGRGWGPRGELVVGRKREWVGDELFPYANDVTLVSEGKDDL